ncbi:ATP-binding cassette domain-containing protein [Flavobacteriaceae bacterium]|jgi:cell division transport system ATP-binding protein|nr:ATP-binding cassette domain-containing protein [Flavobacteriaceae bacterium]MDC1180028.1 ATP-binding cassette domain-containing protein [Flavobacteriaceae bacterium]MDC1371782.1 ATP-binding cassette domain-containing protein [Flavobacteriaceae bacterium]
MSTSILNIEEVSIFQQDETIFENINININKGDFIYLIGKTGSGKSSLIKTIYADLELQKGDISVGGFTLKNLKENKIPFLRRKLGIVFQDFNLLQDRSVFENLKFVLQATEWKNKIKIKERINEVLEIVNIKDLIHKFPHQLSGGQKQKVAISRALLNNPDLIIADEPTGNLDPKTSLEIMQLLLDLNKKGNTILMATHDFILIKEFPHKTLLCNNKTIRSIDVTGMSVENIYE